MRYLFCFVMGYAIALIIKEVRKPLQEDKTIEFSVVSKDAAFVLQFTASDTFIQNYMQDYGYRCRVKHHLESIDKALKNQ